MEHPPIRYLMTAIVQEQDVDVAERALALLEVPVIHLASTGGFLGRRNATLFIGLPEGMEEASPGRPAKILPPARGISGRPDGGHAPAAAHPGAGYRRRSHRFCHTRGTLRGDLAMKLILAIVRDSDSDSVTQGLTSADFRVTRVASTGGLLRRGMTTLLIGLEAEQVDVCHQSPAPDLHPRLPKAASAPPSSLSRSIDSSRFRRLLNDPFLIISFAGLRQFHQESTYLGSPCGLR